MKRTKMLLALVAASALTLAGCGNSSSEQSAEGLKGQTIAVAFDSDSPPFTAMENGTLSGFDVDVIDEVAKRSGFTLEKKPLPFDGVLPALLAGQAQIGAASMSITDKRKEAVNFSSPYFRTGIVLATRPDSPVQGVEDLKGRSVAVRTGSNNSLYMEQLPFASEIEIHRYNTTNEQLTAVLSGVDDAVANDGSILDFYIAKQGEGKLEIRGPLLTQDNYGYAVPKDRPEVKEAIDTSLLAMVGDGTYAKIYQKYFGKEPEASALPGNLK
jgi:ABC-type amino acid transport substrate-binding protein